MRARWAFLLSCLGLVLVGWLVWAAANTEPPPPPVLIADVIAVLGTLVGAWLILAGRRLVRQLGGASEPGRAYARVLVITAILGIGGPITAVTVGSVFIDTPGVAAGIGMFSILVAAIVALIGAGLLPRMHLLIRKITQERAARVRAEGRAEMAAHLHDTVLQALTLIQKEADNPQVLRLARGTERQLRAWLYGVPSNHDQGHGHGHGHGHGQGHGQGHDQGHGHGHDFATAIRAVAEEIEDRFDVNVELGVVGSGRLDARALAVIAAIREALTNAAKHSGANRVALYAEVAEGESLVIIRDRGRGFDTETDADAAVARRRGIHDSIEGRMRRHGGTATVRSAPGQGTEVELHMPLGAPV